MTVSMVPVRTVYPRVGGGTAGTGEDGYFFHGLSPRGRGNLRDCANLDQRRRSIPAWAGEPPPGCTAGSAPAVYPRVGGGTISAMISSVTDRGLSPRGRGNHRPARHHRPHERSIPAWAGEPTEGQDSYQLVKVYPRVGGGTGHHDRQRFVVSGLSPRGRGNHSGSTSPGTMERSIPAWAGEPAGL